VSSARYSGNPAEFDDGTGWTVVKASTGRIRLTPVADNFPVVSETFRVV